MSGRNILMVSPYYVPHAGGTAISVSQLVDGLCSRGLNCQVVAAAHEEMQRKASIDIPGDEVHRLPGLFRWKSVVIPGIPSLSSLHDVDLVHINTPWPFVPDIYTIFSRLRDLPTVLTIRDMFSSETPSEEFLAAIYRNTLGKAITKLVDAVTVTSPFMETYVRDTFGLEAEVIPNGVEFPKLRGVSDGERSGLLYVGRLERNKGVHFLPSIFETLCTKGYDGELHIIGSGPEEERLRSDFQTKRVSTQVVFRGTIPHSRVFEEMNQARCVLMPSLHEPWGRVAVEAMGMGCPVVGFDEGGLAQILSGSELGFRCPTGDLKQFVSLVEQAQNGGFDRDGSAWAVRREYSWESVTDRYLDLYQGLSAKGG